MRSTFIGATMGLLGCGANEFTITPPDRDVGSYIEIDPSLNEKDRSRLNQAVELMAATPMGFDIIAKAGKDQKLTLTIDNDVEISSLDFEKNILTFGRGVHQMGHYCHGDESFAPVKIRDFLYHEMYHIVKHGPLGFDPSKLYERENETVKATDDYRRAVTGTCPREAYGNNNFLESSQFYPANLRAMPL